MTAQRSYIAYLVRLWRESDTGGWRATLANPHNSEQHNFANLASLMTFLEQQTGETIVPAPAETPRPGAPKRANGGREC
ncbi:MAG: hypothetical protein H6666_16240 [Ardenticatenaceae bacterium]|nr:hypothetical protein [Anaerolineales bacterium]MCB8919468.1 hypothetical protein [Ardenticatenaceae bacterium]